MALELVRFDKITKNFEVLPQAARLLRSITGPICVVAVCGRARQGKSFLLNQLLRLLGQGPAEPAAYPQQQSPSPATGAAAAAASGRFAVGSTVKPCTKGLWLWSRPIPRTLNGQTCHLLLVDAEGIDSYDQTDDYSNHIFSLAVLLSSVLVYNQLGSIDESSVEKLASVCEFARLIEGKAEGGGAGPSRPGGGSRSGPSRGDDPVLVSELSPLFVWLLRDFQLQPMENGRKLSEREYMEEVLRELPGEGRGEAVRAKNQLRASIKARFPDRVCHALVRPLNDEARLARMDSIPLSELRPEFQEGLKSMVALLRDRVRPKALRGCPLSGPALAGLAEEYCRVINAGGVPTVNSTWQSVVQSECGRALAAATDLYRTRLEAARGREVGLEALDAAHSAALEAAVEAFTQQAVGEPAEQMAFLQRLRAAATRMLDLLRQTKRAEAEARTMERLSAEARTMERLSAEARTMERLSAEARRFSASVRGEDSDLEAAESRLHDFLREYGSEAGLGPDRFMRAAEFLAGTVVPELRLVAQEARSRAAAASRRVSELEARVSECPVNTSSVEARLGRELAAARAAAEAARGEAAALREQLAAARLELATRGEKAEAGTARLLSELAAAQPRRLAAEAAAARAEAVEQQFAPAQAQAASERRTPASRGRAAGGRRRAAGGSDGTPATPAAAAAAAATPGTSHKRDRAAAGLGDEDSGDVDVEMVDAGPSAFAAVAGGGGGAADSGDEEVEVVLEVGTTPEQRPSRRACNAAAERASGRRRPVGATPAAAAAAVNQGAPSGAAATGGAALAGSPFSEEHEVLRTSTRGATRTTATPPATVATAGRAAAAGNTPGGGGGGGGSDLAGSPFSEVRVVKRIPKRDGC